MRQGRRINPFPFIIIGMLIIIMLVQNIFSNQGTGYSFERFQAVVANDAEAVESVVIKQNQEVPTGRVGFSLKSGGSSSFYVSDVNEVVDFLRENNILYEMGDVSRPSWIEQNIMTIIMCFLLFFFIMMFTSSLQGGSSGNGAMMNSVPHTRIWFMRLPIAIGRPLNR